MVEMTSYHVRDRGERELVGTSLYYCERWSESEGRCTYINVRILSESVLLPELEAIGMHLV